MRFKGALVREQGVTFAVVAVKRHVLDSRQQANQTIRSISPAFGRVPIVLMGQDSRGTASYYGRDDIVRFLSNVPLHAIPWKDYSLN